jgi:ATP-binding protein involved in chromosome partitioning
MISLFGSGGGALTAERLSALVGADVPLLAAIPFTPALREGGDDGVPLVLAQDNSPAVHAFMQLAEAIKVRPRSIVGVPLKIHT